MNLDITISDVQRALGLPVDGVAGPQTWDAIHAKLVPAAAVQPLAAIVTGGHVDARSEGVIATLLEPVKPYARALVNLCAQHGITIIVTSGTRTYAEQTALYAQRPKVTNAPAGYSNHNFGLAFDVTIFNEGKPVWESPAYKAVGAFGKSLGLTWGGDWASIDDQPHFELRPEWAAGLSESGMLAQLRARMADQRNMFA